MALKINKEEIGKKNKLVDAAIVQLKKEFVGIDEQIDSIMNNVRVWFLYPQLQNSPCIVNIFGMTGCGKSSLVKRIAQLLDIEKNLVYFNFCAINEQSSWEIEEDIESQLDYECSNRMFVYDEFQYAATLDSHGDEKDNKNSLKPFWELLDTGIIHKRTSFWEIRDVFKSLAYMVRINALCPMEIVDGVWVNSEKCLENFNLYEIKKFGEVFNFDMPKKIFDNEDGTHAKKTTEPTPMDNVSIEKSTHSYVKDKTFFLKENILIHFTELYRKAYGLVCDSSDVYCKLMNMNAVDICDLFNDVYEKSQKGYDLKFNESIIFVIANLDEAYDVAFNVNPDMSPEQFHNITKKIGIVDVKKALQKRFRNEQIARLGNIHVIYPSFTSKSFKKIIDLQLDLYKKTAKELCGLDIEFDKTIKKVVFDEAVYPTQGTRPIFSTIHEIVKTKLPYIVRNICDNNKDEEVSSIRYSYKNKKSIISVLDADGKIIDTYRFNDKLRLGKLRDSTKDEQQACTAVHESGHFVIYSYLNGRVPEKLLAKSADSDMNGFMMHNIEDMECVNSRVEYLNHIKTCLGGYVAEGIIFGEDRRSGGALSDLSTATQIASKMVRMMGMSDLPFVTTHLNKPENDGLLIREENQEYINNKIKKIIEDCLKDTTEIIKMPHIMKMLKSSSKYLAQHSQMPKHMMSELLDVAKSEGEILQNSETYYRDIVKNF